ncbi:hypothetical protein PO124_28435 [Bacillus licheniformis]|nr:hypothetical protein [Bacillus licheniformis]
MLESYNLEIVLSLLKNRQIIGKTNINQSNWKNTMSSKSFICRRG